MSFTYSGNPATSTRDAIRFYAQDVVFDDQLVSDEEIEYVIDSWAHVTDSPIYLAAVVCESIAARFARELSYSADGVSVSGGELQDKYNRLAESLRDQYKAHEIGGGPDVGGIIYGEYYDPSIEPLTWSKKMHDNPGAGQQDFGGVESNREYQPEIDGTYPQ